MTLKSKHDMKTNLHIRHTKKLLLALAGMGAFLTIKLRCSYEGLRFLPLSPALEASTVLAWKKTETFPPATAALLEHIKQCLFNIPDYPK